MMFFPEAFHLLKLWRDMEGWAQAIADRVIWNAVLCSGLGYGLTNQRTFNYRCRWEGFYIKYGAEVPPDAISSDDIEIALERWQREYGRGLAFELNQTEGLLNEQLVPACCYHDSP